jgi:hypothetical protein
MLSITSFKLLIIEIKLIPQIIYTQIYPNLSKQMNKIYNKKNKSKLTNKLQIQLIIRVSEYNKKIQKINK